MSNQLTIAAFQGRAIYDDVDKSLAVISKTVSWAESKNVDILCFPECFLQGYILDVDMARQVSLDLNSPEFDRILQQLQSDSITTILGVIEREGDSIYNTAVVIEKGKLMGKYRKHFIHNKESFFTAGLKFPIFKKKGITYGINICYDSRFPESAQALVKQGAQIIFCPLNNSLPHAKADEWRYKHIQYFMEKAQYSSCWIVSADVVDSSETNTGYGCTCVVNPAGKIIDEIEHSKEGGLVQNITL